eukprot:COSAG02_NODE_5729_length_4088_cov_1.319629_3_plen_59_part_00
MVHTSASIFFQASFHSFLLFFFFPSATGEKATSHSSSSASSVRANSAIFPHAGGATYL